MVRFACFLSHINYHKSKKGMPQSAATMDLTPHVSFQEEAVKPPAYNDNNLLNTSLEQVNTPSSQEDCCKSDVLTSKHSPDGSKMFSQMVRLKKSQSLGSVLDKRRGFSGDNVSEDDEIDQEFSFDNFHDNNIKKDHDSFASTDSAEVHDQITGVNTGDQNQDNEMTGSFELVADPGCHESIFSVGDLKLFEGEHQHHNIGEHFNDLVADSIHSSSNTLPILAKSCSAVNLRMDTTNSIEGSVTHEFTGPRSRSFEDISPLHGGRGEFLNGEEAHQSERAFQKRTTEGYSHNMPDERGSSGYSDSKEECQFSNTSGEFNSFDEQERDDKYSNEKYKCDNQSVDAYEPQNYDELRNEWKEAEEDGAEMKKGFQQDSSILNWDDLTSEEFTIKRIEDWISQIDFHAGSAIQENGESSRSVPKKDPPVLKKASHVVAGSRHDYSNLGMEVAYNYISSLSGTSSSAQMSNLGLVTLPFLGAFASLRMLNLSGNGIVRITSGALPRGLHMLNLSKNNISTIEGLRDLSRLRVLYLSHNRIVRLGHGLAYCSSLKELYLAGNKISEVEGLHRLLKLNVLDLSFNKISTAKCLGQLAANYGSLQAIHLGGNPAQQNVGDEQLKKYLLSLLPRLVYYNKQTIRPGSSKDIVDRSQRSLTSHQFERVTRIDQKHSRRASHGSAIHRSTSSNHGRASPVMSSRGKQSKSRHVRLPPPGPKATTHHQPRLLSLEPRNPIRRSLSEGML